MHAFRLNWHNQVFIAERWPMGACVNRQKDQWEMANAWYPGPALHVLGVTTTTRFIKVGLTGPLVLCQSESVSKGCKRSFLSNGRKWIVYGSIILKGGGGYGTPLSIKLLGRNRPLRGEGNLKKVTKKTFDWPKCVPEVNFLGLGV